MPDWPVDAKKLSVRSLAKKHNLRKPHYTNEFTTGCQAMSIALEARAREESSPKHMKVN